MESFKIVEEKMINGTKVISVESESMNKNLLKGIAEKIVSKYNGEYFQIRVFFYNEGEFSKDLNIPAKHRIHWYKNTNVYKLDY